MLALLEKVRVKGLAHITGGGITENIPRVLPHGLDATIETSSWHPGAVFDFLAEQGGIEDSEMRRTFNCGIGMVVVVAAQDADEAIALLTRNGESAWHVGNIVPGRQEVRYA